ncbi:restriction endonuclease [Sphingobacterium siyangense]|uniref:Restriction endonuclease n=1 Tax=Sphingobacterium siyangense TaxID=459529 RepID=A0A562MKE8_9SPHI|nr:restriction endonuclease [Sphingobacterium siyangense]TWI20340.1 restriction endonuclease [Sphingobacterium siyangense]
MAKDKILDFDELKDLYRNAKSLETPTKAESRQRGYDLERIVEFLLIDLEVKAAYNTAGEQIDGSFFLFGQTFLLEAKWHAKSLPASDIYAFKGKVDGKFHTSSGIFISYSGYSSQAIEALRSGKSINILLFDKTDLDSIIEEEVPFIDVLKFKLREAGDTGLPYVPYSLAKVAKRKVQADEIVMVPSKYGKLVDDDLGGPVSPMFLVLSNLSFSEQQISTIIKDLQLYQSVSFQFKRIRTDQFLVSTISTFSSLLAADADNNFMGVLLLVENNQFDDDDEDYLLEVLHKNAIAVDISVVRIQESNKVQNKIVLSKSNIQGIKKFMRDLLEVDSCFYNKIGARNALRNELNEADWDYEEKSITFIDGEHGMPFSIDSFQNLLSHLSDVANNIATEETPLDILNDAEYDQDFDDLAYEVLSEYKKRLSKLGWGDEI